MKHLSYILAVASCLLLVTACGFKPMYGSAAQKDNAFTAAELASIQIANIPDRNGQTLRNDLVDRLNPAGKPAAPTYRLEITDLEEHIRDLDITIRSDTTREQMKITANMALIDITTAEPVLIKELSARGSYNILENEYASRASQLDLRNDLLEKIALQAERYISLHLTTN